MPHRYIAKRLKRFFIYRVLHVDDTPHRIALGVAIGIFVTWTPTIGFQMALTVALAALFRANKLVGVPFVWLSNPLTLVPVYYPSFCLGAWMLGRESTGDDFISALAKAATFTGSWWERVQNWWTATVEFFGPLWLGSIPVALSLGLITYILVYYAVIGYRKHPIHFHHRAQAAAEQSPDTEQSSANDR